MLTTLDAQPQGWMEGDAHGVHTVSACHFQNHEHAEYWVRKLVPTNKNGRFVKWSGGRRKVRSRSTFMANCLRHASEIDFRVNCISSLEGQMSWFAWAFYMQNRNLVRQELDNKGRNCLVFPINQEVEFRFPVLRAGYLIWYHRVVEYLAQVKTIRGMVLSDNFCNDDFGTHSHAAQGVAFVNFLLSQSGQALKVSLPTSDQFRDLDRLSDCFCGWVNSVRLGLAPAEHERLLSEFEKHKGIFDSVVLAADIRVTDENGNDVTQLVKEKVANDSPENG